MKTFKENKELGDIGEDIVRDHVLKSKIFQTWLPQLNKSSFPDIICEVTEGDFIFIEVKTSYRLYIAPAVGIDVKAFADYSQSKKKIVLVFVDCMLDAYYSITFEDFKKNHYMHNKKPYVRLPGNVKYMGAIGGTRLTKIRKMSFPNRKNLHKKYIDHLKYKKQKPNHPDTWMYLSCEYDQLKPKDFIKELGI
jgi:hypothetical protein